VDRYTANPFVIVDADGVHVLFQDVADDHEPPSQVWHALGE
jgi:hypothetical protein